VKDWQDVMNELLTDVKTNRPKQSTLATFNRIAELLEYWRDQEARPDHRPVDCSSTLLLAWVTGVESEWTQRYRQECLDEFQD
jgi:hypothetical protein